MQTSSIKRITIGVLCTIVLIVLGMSSLVVFENVPAGKICVIQSPISGKLEIYYEPGVKPQLFGKVTYYPKSDIYSFSQPIKPVNKEYVASQDQPIPIVFNDSGGGFIPGSIRFDYPVEPEKMKLIHTTFSSHESVVKGLIKPTVERAITLTGSMMSSIEAFMARKADLPVMIEDQAKFGLYRTKTYEKTIMDEITNDKKTIKVSEPIRDENAPNGIARQESSVITKYGIVFSNFSFTGVTPSEKVYERINVLFDMYAKIEQSTLNVRNQEQETKAQQEIYKKEKAIEKGKAEAISAKEKEIANREKEIAIIIAEREKQVAITNAEREKEVAALKRDAAALYKEEQKLRGEGDAAYKKAVIEADGALQQKLAAYVEIQKFWARAFAERSGNIVPDIVVGKDGTNSNSTNAMDDYLKLLSIKAAKDLQLDTSIK